MTAGPTIKPGFFGKRALPAAEWLAENAYIPPGMHRLLAAGGLALGLWGGRAFMDVLTARRNSDGSDIPRQQIPELFRPLHGVLHYDRYSDRAEDRWRSVVDKFVPAVTGGLMAYYGGKHFFHGQALAALDKSKAALHPLSAAARKNLANNVISSHTISQIANSHQADSLRKSAAASYVAGAPIGTDKAGGAIFGNHNLWADSFAVGADIKPRFPEIPIPGLQQMIRWVNHKALGNYSTASLGASRSMRNAAKWVEGNLHTQRDLNWASPEALRRWATDALQNYPRTSERDIDNVAREMRRVIEKAHAGMPAGRALSAGQQTALSKTIGGSLKEAGFIDQGMDRLLDNAGIDIGKLRFGRHGLFSLYARGLPFIGSAKEEAKAFEAYAKYVGSTDTYGNKVFRNATAFDASPPTLSTRQALGFWGSMAGATGAVVGAGAAAAHAINRRAAQVSDGHGGSTVVTSDYQSPDQKKEGGVAGWVNGAPLDMAEWASRMVIVPPSMHRLMSAAYLSAALYGGMKLANVLTGRKLPLLRSGDLNNSLLTRDKVWLPFRPLHNLLHYTPGSSLAQDRWRMASHYLIPVGFGAAGTYTGSALFFQDRTKKLENPSTLEDYVDKIAMEQSNVFAGVTAVTSVFNTGSGIHLIPFLNYSSNLQSRYLLGAGLQVSTPGLGKWWSGNAGLTPWGIKRTLTHTGNYLGHNDSVRPREVPALVHSVLGKLYPQMPEQELLLKKRNFLHAIYEVRDAYFVDGKLPPERKEELTKTMKHMLSGDGFEQLLLKAGFDPAQADLANNGASGNIANFFGSKNKVEHLKTEYKHKFTERLASNPVRSTADMIAKHGRQHPAANDAGPAPANDNGGHSHADRLAQRDAVAHTPTQQR